ncbi:MULTISPECIES: hypothetical protein [Noviherbaspirillum]|jgi:hypothetical protein|uniref:Uncharacterized protein n=1 Tax=Noviherbaspirillum galbum TaxID=2709383 RepID=A0A6B3SW57_9BURK|nr:hypothetical protein [Noviherbaspirillum galbum]NEX63625.1 hypothetical protein [Noviherbaspirillum galbum]
MSKYETISLGMSALALVISAATGYFQYQTRQDSVEERIKVELKMMLDKSPLNPLDLRMISGVEERENLQPAVLITNIGSATVRILEAGYQDFDLPNHAFYAGTEQPRTLSPGEQAIFPISDIVKVNRQLVDDIKLGEEKNAKIFAVSTKGNRFEAPAVIEVAK